MNAWLQRRLEAAGEMGRARRREMLIDFGEWISQQKEIDVFTVDEAVDKYLEECG